MAKTFFIYSLNQFTLIKTHFTDICTNIWETKNRPCLRTREHTLTANVPWIFWFQSEAECRNVHISVKCSASLHICTGFAIMSCHLTKYFLHVIKTKKWSTSMSNMRKSAWLKPKKWTTLCKYLTFSNLSQQFQNLNSK